MADSRAIRTRARLNAAYLIVFPGFLFVVAAFSRERACFDHIGLLPGVARQPALAALLALVYVLGYSWAAAAYAVTARDTRALLPTLAQAHAIWGSAWWRPASLLILLLVDYTPPPLLRAVARLIGVCEGI